MTTRSAVDPELLPLLDAWPTVALSDEILDQVRARVLPLPPHENPTVEIDQHIIPGPAEGPDVMLRAYRPAGQGVRGCIYHIHGGGYVAGNVEALEVLHRSLADTLDCIIVSIDYRLAPETPHPGPIEDCYAGLIWVQDNAGLLDVDPGRIGLMGESAGGGLAAALALLARDRGRPALAFQCLIYPMLDDRTCIMPDPHPMTGEFIWTAHNNRFGWCALLGKEPGAGDVSPYAAAARARDLKDLPPTFIMTGALDLFLEEDIDYARRLMRTGVPCELHVYPGAFHGFDLAHGARIADQANSDRLGFLKRSLA